MTMVGQQKIRRRGTGLTAYDPSLTYDGYPLFAPMLGDGTVYLIDMQGQPVHTWILPHPPGDLETRPTPPGAATRSTAVAERLSADLR